MALTPPPSGPPAAPTAPGDAPSRANPSTFRELADAFVVWQVGFRDWLAGMVAWLASYITWAGTNVTELSALQTDVQHNSQAAVDASGAATAASAATAHIYPGVYSTPPLTRPNGSPVQLGDAYFTADGLTHRWTGLVWVASDLDAAALAGASGSSNVGFTAAGADAATRTLEGKGRDSVSLLDYYKGEASYDLAFQRAMASAATEIRVPDGNYGLLAMLNVTQGKYLKLSQGATVFAMPGFSGDRLVQVGPTDTTVLGCNYWGIEGGYFHCKQLCAYGIVGTRLRYGRLRTIVIGALTKGIWMGTSAIGAVGDNTILPGTEVWWWDINVNAPVQNGADSIGIHYDKSADSTCYSPQVIGYRTGIQSNAGSVRWIAPHVWTASDHNHGPMTVGLHALGQSNSWISPYLDTPTNVGDASITDVYGMRIGAFGNKLYDVQFFNNGSNGIDNLTTILQFDIGLSQTVVSGMTVVNASTVKTKAYFGGFWTAADKVTIMGLTEDARTYDFSQRIVQFADRPITFGVPLTFGQDLSFPAQAIFTSNVKKSGAAGTNRTLQFQTSGSDRWQVGANNAAESGGDAGSDYSILAFGDDGSFKFTPLQIRRSTGRVILGDPASVGARVEINTDITTSAVAGAATALPATPTGYISVRIANATKKIPYYD